MALMEVWGGRVGAWGDILIIMAAMNGSAAEEQPYCLPAHHNGP